jgi:thiosulfate/3-mercaptopyruvate sulfurtransferase
MSDGQEGVPALVDPEWLESHLDDPDLRVLDCTVHLEFDEETGERRSESGRADWEESHVPGSAYAPLLTDLSADDPAFPYELPSAEAFEDAMGRLGVGDDSRVVLYDSEGNAWATRLWWMLRVFGFDRAGVLDGGWSRWVADGRPVSAAPPTHERASFTANPRPELVADKAEVRESIDDEDVCLVNALRPADHAGEGANKYGRLGRIPSSVNVPAVGESAIVDADRQTYQSREELRERFEAAGATACDRVVTYCGGGIAATSAAFALHLVGVDDVAVYDGSLSEWAADPEMPMTTGSPEE